MRLLQCERYIAVESQDWPTVIKWRERIMATVEILKDFPESGGRVAELRREDVRELLVGDYRVIYRLKDRNVDILSVRHGHFLINSIHSL